MKNFLGIVHYPINNTDRKLTKVSSVIEYLHLFKIKMTKVRHIILFFKASYFSFFVL
jgi:hypothetical protein